jgi:hypothetical protein
MAQFVVVAVTLVGIYYQFRLQRSANAFDQLSRIEDQWNSEPHMRTRLSAARAIKAGNSAPMASMVAIGNFWEGVATLVRLGHVDPRFVYDALGNSARYWWALMEDETLRYREETESDDLMVHFEWLAAKFAHFADQDGTRTDFAKTTLVAERSTSRSTHGRTGSCSWTPYGWSRLGGAKAASSTRPNRGDPQPRRCITFRRPARPGRLGAAVPTWYQMGEHPRLFRPDLDG